MFLLRTAFARALSALTLAVVSLALLAVGQIPAAWTAAGLLALFGAWVLGTRSATQQPVSNEPIAIAPTEPNGIDVLWRCTQRIEQSRSLDDALVAVTKVLGSELGALGVRAMSVEWAETGSPETALVRVMDAAFAEIEGYRPVPVPIQLDRFPLGVAIKTQQLVGDQTSGYAVPICASGRTLAVLEIPQVTLSFAEPTMHQFLLVLAHQLARCNACTSTCESAVAKSPEPRFDALSLLADAVPQALFLFDAQSLGLLYLNPAAKRWFALSSDVAQGASVQEVFHPAMAAQLEPTMRKVIHDHDSSLADGGPDFACDHLWSPDPMPSSVDKVVHVQYTVVPDALGTTRCLLMTVRDVTHERAAPNELSESKMLLQQFAETAEESLFVTHPPRGDFQFLAGALSSVWGLSREALLTNPNSIWSRVIDEDRSQLIERVTQQPSDHTDDFDFRILHPSKGQRWLRSRTRVVRLGSGQERVYSSVRDVTDDKHREIELRAARDAAESESIARSRFLAHMTHEVRTPMNGILGMTELLLGTPLQENQKRFAQAIYRSGESLLEVFNQIFDFSHTKPGELEQTSSVPPFGDAQSDVFAGNQRFQTMPVRKAELRHTIAPLWSESSECADGSDQRPFFAGSVLVVEDNKVNQEVIGQMLRGWGLRVQIASDAASGLRLLCESHFDLVLMDILMPGVDGTQAIRTFRSGWNDGLDFKTPSNTPVIAVTANALLGDEERFLSLGFNDYLSKPLRQNQLFMMLTRYLRPHAMMTVPSNDHERGVSMSSCPDAAPTPATADSEFANWETVLDRAALERLGELDPTGQNKLMQRVIDAFETSVARLLPQIKSAGENNDRDGMRHVAHTLKSSSASIGALRLSKMCAELEALIRLERSDDPSPHVHRICRETEVVLKALREVGAVAATFSDAAKGQPLGTST